MRKIKYYIPFVLILMILSGCNSVNTEIEDKEQYEDYNKVVIEYNIDTSEYIGAIQDILNANNNTKEIVDKCIEKHSNIMTDGLKSLLINSIIEIDNLNSNMEDMTNPEFDNTEKDAEISIVDEDGNEVTLYPIYDTLGNIYDYGTLEESEESLEIMVSSPVFSVESIDGYEKDLVATVNSRGNVVIKVLFKIYDGKLGEYTIYR